jgi:hypothetical protein
MVRVVLWHMLMLVWLALLIRGGWWMWPAFEKLEFSQDAITGLLWLAMGSLLWLLAFLYGRERYWRHGRHLSGPRS